jgi:hypothetical protein
MSEIVVLKRTFVSRLSIRFPTRCQNRYAQEQTLIRPYLLEAYRGVEHYVGPKDTLGVVLSGGGWDYPL